METDPAHNSQTNEADHSPEIQTGVGAPAKKDNNPPTILEKSRQAAYESLERYLVSQYGHVQTDETDLLIPEPSMIGQTDAPPITTEQDVRESLQALQDLLPKIRATRIATVGTCIFLFIVCMMITLCIWYLTPLHKSASPWAKLCWTPSEFLSAEAGLELTRWFILGRCMTKVASVRLKLDDGRLRGRDKYQLRGYLWRIMSNTPIGKLKDQATVSMEGNV